MAKWATDNDKRREIADLWALIAIRRAGRGDLDGMERAATNSGIVSDSMKVWRQYA